MQRAAHYGYGEADMDSDEKARQTIEHSACRQTEIILI